MKTTKRDAITNLFCFSCQESISLDEIVAGTHEQHDMPAPDRRAMELLHKIITQPCKAVPAKVA